MPVDRTLAIDLASTPVEVYTEAQDRLAADLARDLAAGITSPDWAANKLAAVTTLRRRTEALLAKLDSAAGDRVAQALVLAYVRGGQAAVRELGRQQLTSLERLALRNKALDRLAALAGKREAAIDRELTAIRRDLPGVDALQRLIWSLTSTLRGTHMQILRWDLDVYRQVIARTVATGTLLGTDTRLQTAQRALDDFVSRGVTGFVDKSGRRWQLASYVEMATRTATAQAAVQGHLDRLGDAGIDLVVVSDAPQECVLCRPWEGKVLARTGAAGRHTVKVEHATRDGLTVEVPVAGSVVEAVAAGLLHPNCRHSLSAYLPGVTQVPHDTADPDGDAARQRQRAIERHIRAWKTRQAAAMSPTTAKTAGARVREWQAALRTHLGDHPELRRLRHREQIGTAR